jgi:hypothetical protein
LGRGVKCFWGNKFSFGQRGQACVLRLSCI